MVRMIISSSHVEGADLPVADPGGPAPRGVLELRRSETGPTGMTRETSKVRFRTQIGKCQGSVGGIMVLGARPSQLSCPGVNWSQGAVKAGKARLGFPESSVSPRTCPASSSWPREASRLPTPRRQ